jgi:CheY-like chemotaxis protein
MNAQTAKVLVVEDNTTNQTVIQAMLTRFAMSGKLNRGNLSMEIVEDGQQAVDFVCRDGEPDLVLMDIQMPVMDGLEAAQRIRQWEAAHGKSRVPIIALTANASDEDRNNCFAAGMDDFIAKPVHMDQLELVLMQWLNRFQ